MQTEIYDPVHGTTVNDKLSRQMRVPPLFKDQEVIYRLIQSTKDDPTRTDLKGKPLKCTQGYTMCGTKVIFDPIAGRKVTIESGQAKEVKIKTPLGEFVTHKPKSIQFRSENPTVHVTYDQPELYAFMERVDENADNPFRNKKIKPRFERVDNRKKVLKEIEKSEFKLDAMNWVMKEAAYKDLISCAEKAKAMRPDVIIKTDYKNSEASSAYEILKRELFALAESDPLTIIKCSTRIDSQVKLQIRDAAAFKLVLFADGNKIKPVKDKIQLREWFHNDENLTSICVVPPGEDKFECLLNFFAKDKDGDKHYKKMIAVLDRVLNPNKFS